MTSRPPSFTKKWEHCHDHSFYPIFFKFGMWVVFLITRFGFVTQLSSSSTFGRIMGWKSTKWSPICHFLQTELLFMFGSLFDRFWPPENENMRRQYIWRETSGQKLLKSKNSKWPPKPEVMQKLKRIVLNDCIWPPKHKNMHLM